MKTIVLVSTILFLVPLALEAQSTLNFPHVLEAADFATAGFALVNPGLMDATVTFTLFGTDGSTLSTSSQPIKAASQIAKLAKQLFPGTASGWVQVTSTTSGLQGFWFGGDLVSFADGSEPAPSATELVLPMIAPSSDIHVANTGNAPVTL